MAYLSNYLEEIRKGLLESFDAFYAVGQKQFDEQKKDGVKYVSLGGFLICPKENANNLVQKLNETFIEAVKKDVSENGAEKIIRREYFNYETQISGDTSEAKDSLSPYMDLFPELFNEQLIEKTFRKCFCDAVENDWF